jgi:hypothetical protein
LNFLANEVNCIFVAKVNHMATLSGQKVKDAFASLLKLSTNTATSTLKNVESGDGVTTALQIGTTKVGVNGTLEFPTVPSTGSTETDALFLNASNQVVKRTLNAAAFSGGAVTTATLPLAITSSTVRLDNPSSISDIGTIANGDRFLIWDVSASAWRRIDYSVLSGLINPGAYQSAPELVARTSAALSLTASPQYLEFQNVGPGATDSNKIGDALSYFELTSVYGGTNDSVTFLEDGGVYQIMLCAPLTSSGGAGVEVKFNFQVNGVTVNSNQTTLGSGASHFITQSTFVNLNGGDVISVTALETGSGSVELNQYAILHFRKL